MNKIINALKRHAVEKMDSIAYTVYEELSGNDFSADSLTWKELDTFSDRLSGYIRTHTKMNTPIIVYGHKSKYMMVCFMACVKSGHAYVPVDISIPISRIQDIIDTVEPEIILMTVDNNVDLLFEGLVVDLNQMKMIADNSNYKTDENIWLKSEDTFYIIFTSGSTGKPKGVQITTGCLTNYVEWAQDLGGRKASYRFLNQAPFSFDLSVMDVYLSLYTGGTICAITKDIQKNLKLLYRVLSETDINVWVSTPSFADVCLSDRNFNRTLLPHLKRFLFCGEILTNKTAKRLRSNFQDSIIINTYGPTESTVCVTEIVIDDRIIDTYNPLPVGAARPGTWLYIIDEKGNCLPDGEQGEIVIVGDTVSIGYFKNEEQTKKVFSTKNIDDVEYRLYRTGDKGYIRDGQLFYCGRIDFQIKLHGYRIEIEDIENNLVKINGVKKAVVLPNVEDNRVKSLTAYVVYDGDRESDFKASQEIRNQMKDFVPEYMVPKKIKFIDSIPMTMNGKVDREALIANT